MTFAQIHKIFSLKKSLSHKVIRLNSINQISPTLQKQLKIIFLIRDPRGIASSRLKYIKHAKDKEPATLAKHVCSTYRQFIIDRQASPSWLKNTLILRYEDLATNPKNFIKKIYKFTNLKLHKEVELYVKSQTNDSQKIAISWAKSLKYEFVQAIEEECRDVMETFGYKMVGDEVGFNRTRMGKGEFVEKMGCLDCVW